MSYPFNIRGVYSFDVYPSTILGSEYQNCTVMSYMDYETALQQADIPAIHTQVYPYLPSGTPDDPSQYDYIKIKMSDGSTVILGIAWINLSSVTEIDSVKFNVVIEGVASSDVTKLRNALSQNGFNNFNITVLAG
jgi:hypothetical protein